ncbi:rossman fold oxidoreductase [Cryptococcus neoformans MW-RSA852]|nr:rossman fold oxidoreductase [Cryptococcus neoformans var. grubii MW-RSA852]
MSVAVIQGASGGLGQALTRYILRYTGLTVYALTHQASSQGVRESLLSEAPNIKHDSERLTVISNVDVREEDGLRRGAEMIRSKEGSGSVRVIVCLAGILKAEKSLSAINLHDALSSFQINALGQLITYKHFVPLIPTKNELSELKEKWNSKEEGSDPAKGMVDGDHSICCSLSARVGSIRDNEKGGWYSYRSSKAAVNQIIRTLDHELSNRSSSAIAYAYHPGTVLTPFTFPIIGSPKPDLSQGRLTVDRAIDHLVNVMSQVKRGVQGSRDEGDWGGRCWDWKGQMVEW